VLLDDLSHHELLETRLIVEPELAARAAERATAEDISILRNAVLALERSKGIRDRLDADMAFHNAIFRASGNRICQLLFKGIHRTVFTSMNQLSERASVEQPIKSHRKIYAAIRARDAEAARSAMRDHILEARALLSKKS
jgi:DNA-binding FadR family transcriptional regulator